MRPPSSNSASRPRYSRSRRHSSETCCRRRLEAPRRNSSTSRHFPRIGPRWPTCTARWEMSNVNTMKMLLALPPSALLLTGCASTKPVPQTPQAVQTQRVGLGPAVSGGELRYSAVVEADAEIPLSFRIPGYVVGLMQVRGEGGRMRDVAEGDRVGKGAVLVRIRAAEYEDR